MRRSSLCASRGRPFGRSRDDGAVALETAIVTSLILLPLFLAGFMIGGALFARRLLLEAASGVARTCALQQLRDAGECQSIAADCAAGGYLPICQQVLPWCSRIEPNVTLQTSGGQGSSGPQVQAMNVQLTCDYGAGGELVGLLPGTLQSFTVSALMPYSLQLQPEVQP